MGGTGDDRLCAIFSYQYHGLSSRQIRALIGASVFLLFFPRELLTTRFLRGLTLLGAVCSLGFTAYYALYLDLPRGEWPINAIPQSTLSASIAVLALAQLLKKKDKFQTALSAAAFLFSISAVFLSQTRGIWLAFTCAFIMLVILNIRKKEINKKFILAAVAVLFAAGFTLKPQLEQRLAQTQNEVKQIAAGNLNTSIGFRLQMWQLAPQLVSENIAFGLGGNHSSVFTELYEQGLVSQRLYRYQPAHYHNQYLDRTIKNGVVGLALLLAILLVPLTQLGNLDPKRRYMVAGLVLLFAIASLTDVPFNHGQTIFMYLLLVCGLGSKAETEQ